MEFAFYNEIKQPRKKQNELIIFRCKIKNQYSINIYNTINIQNNKL